MATATLTDSLREALTLAQAAHLFAPVPHIATLHRWRTIGVMANGVRVKLATWRRGGVVTTTPAAVEEFLRAINVGADDPGDSPTDAARRSRAAGKALETIGG
ncbi:MAG: DUF1580 domain-containing protein [Planctomycetaceae bacterium]|nr:DUF1580 domain-containing protein [Planctomycetaceae bacterium]